MELRCEECGKTGEPAETDVSGGDIVVTCRHCGTESRLEAESSDPVADSEASSTESVSESPVEERDGPELGNSLDLDEVVPEPGEGPRCPKCAALIEPTVKFCPNCGLKQALVERSGDQTVKPWEEHLEVREKDVEDADALWADYRGQRDEAALDEWIALVRRRGIEKWAIGKLRFWLVENPNDQNAKRVLAELLQEFQKQAIGASKALEAESEGFKREITNLRSWLLALTVAFWGLVIFLIVYFGF